MDLPVRLQKRDIGHVVFARQFSPVDAGAQVDGRAYYQSHLVDLYAELAGKIQEAKHLDCYW